MAHSLVIFREEAVNVHDGFLELVLPPMCEAWREGIIQNQEDREALWALLKHWKVQLEYPNGIKNIYLDNFLTDSSKVESFLKTFNRAIELLGESGEPGNLIDKLNLDYNLTNTRSLLEKHRKT